MTDSPWSTSKRRMQGKTELDEHALKRYSLTLHVCNATLNTPT